MYHACRVHIPSVFIIVSIHHHHVRLVNLQWRLLGCLFIISVVILPVESHWVLLS